LFYCKTFVKQIAENYEIYPFSPSTIEDVSLWKGEGIEAYFLFLQYVQRFLAELFAIL